MLDQKLKELEKLLGRQPEVVWTKKGKFAVEYIDFEAKASELVGETVEEAVDKLLAFLKSKKYAQNQEIQHDETGAQSSREDNQET